MFPELSFSFPVQSVTSTLITDRNISLSVLRIDLTDPVISGNKWFKLKYNLMEARSQGYNTLLSFGGPYSNHLHALAAAGKASGFNTIGIVRGEQHLPLNPTLADVVNQGMKLYYIDRKTYRHKHEPEVIEQISAMIRADKPFSETNEQTFSSMDSSKNRAPFYLVPEGGTNALAVKGASEIALSIPINCDYICVPCGTGGTIAGIIDGLARSHNSTVRVLGFPAMKGGNFMKQEITRLLTEQQRHFGLAKYQLPHWQLMYDYHFGGFGKINSLLASFIHDFEEKQKIDLDPVYTAKMMYGIVDLIQQDFFPEGSKIVAIHTGGLQGKRGMTEKIQNLLSW